MPDQRRPFPVWAYAALSVALIQVLVGLSSPWVAGAVDPSQIPNLVFVLLMAVFGGCAALLAFGGRGDRRALYLAAAYLLSASAFAFQPLSSLMQALPAEAGSIGALRAANMEVLLAFFSWRFAREFPRATPTGRVRALARLATVTSLWLGIALIAAGAVSYALTSLGAGELARALAPLQRGGVLYWPLLLALLALSVFFSVWKAGHTGPTERRRVVWMTLGLSLGIAPVVIVNGLEYTVPAFSRFARSPGGLRVIGAIAYPLIVTGPLITVYAVLVHRALDVKLVVRKALRYAMARYSLAVLAMAPFAASAFLLWVNRAQSLSRIFSGATGALLVAGGVTSLLAVRVRGRLIRTVDRVFFREQYDANEILTELARTTRNARDGRHLGQLLKGEIERALHPGSSIVLVLDPRAALLVPAAPGRSGARPLPLESELVDRLRDVALPVEVDPERPEWPVAQLGRRDSAWLRDAGARLLVPLVSTAGQLQGLIALGEKRSELPYSREDKGLLTAIGSAAALTIENRVLRTSDRESGGPRREPESAGTGAPEATYAKECLSCGVIQELGVERCPECQAPLAIASVPPVLASKYRMVRRIGRGGMGVVYHAVDLALGRDVAIKALPHMSPKHSQRLRREARAVAAVSHPNLATIYAAESLHGAPFLVFEYLPGGTLAQRLRQGPLELRDAVDLGCALADATCCIHEAGILHRDIKPSNIGFSRSDVPKLLDFGLARMLEVAGFSDLMPTRSSLSGGQKAANRLAEETFGTMTGTRELLGTALYMSPEAMDALPPTHYFDLWSISILLYEAIAGRHPLAGGTYYRTIARVIQGDVPDIRECAPHLSEQVADFFRLALHSDIRKRPSSARDLRARLAGLVSGQAGTSG